ncbi:hypothetical protein BSK56_33065, partial [Paenibacillus borealis]
KIPRPGAHVRSPLFRGLGNIKDAIAKLCDGKLKNHALRLPKNLDSLKGFMQSVARKMNIRIKRLSPERQRQIDTLESGEYP